MVAGLPVYVTTDPFSVALLSDSSAVVSIRLPFLAVASTALASSVCALILLPLLAVYVAVSALPNRVIREAFSAVAVMAGVLVVRLAVLALRAVIRSVGKLKSLPWMVAPFSTTTSLRLGVVSVMWVLG